jgi:uncharacterized protein (TIGR03000 family)
MYLGDFFWEGRKDRAAAATEYGLALEVFSGLLKENPRSLDLQQRLGATWYRVGLTAPTPEKATEAYQESLKFKEELAKIDPQDLRAGIELALVLGKLGRALEVEGMARRMRGSGANDRGLRLNMVEALQNAIENAGNATLAEQCREQAFAILGDLVREGRMTRDQLATDHDLDRLRKDARFADLLSGKLPGAVPPGGEQPPDKSPVAMPPNGAQGPDKRSVVEDSIRSSFYPLTVGNAWTYKSAGASIQVVVVGIEKVGEVQTYKLETRAGGKVSATENIAVQKDGVYRYLVNGQKPDRPIKFLALPPARGTTWKVESQVANQEMAGEIVIKEEDVTVPAGTFAKATVSEAARMKIGGADTAVKYWFAEGVGVVKLQFHLAGQEATLELEKFERSRKSPATIRLLIPKTPTRTTLTIEGNTLAANDAAARDGVRLLSTPELEPGKTYAYKVEATIEPNNYEKIVRTREVKFKAGEDVALDLRQKDDKFPDKVFCRWIPTPDDVVDQMCELAKVGPNDVVLDPGCGDAVILLRAVQNFRAKRARGIDIDTKLVQVAQKNVATAGWKDKVAIKEGDALQMTAEDLKDVTVVALYMGDELNNRMRPLLWQHLPVGARVVSHRFLMGDWAPDQSITVKGADGDDYLLHLWTITGKEKTGEYPRKK